MRTAAAAQGAACHGRAAKEVLSGQRGGSSLTKSSPLRAALGRGWELHALPAVAPLLRTPAAWLAAPGGIPRARLGAVVQGHDDEEEEEEEDAQ